MCLILSSGDASFTLDDYIGKDYRDVQATLKVEYKCNVRIEKKKVKEEENKEIDTILSISVVDGSEEKEVSAGDVIKNGSTVVLYIPEIEIVYPDFTSGYSVDQVKEFAEKYHLELIVNYEENTVLPDGTILKQDREKDSPVIEGIKLNITVTKKPDPIDDLLPSDDDIEDDDE